jgi:hypothetical protein
MLTSKVSIFSNITFINATRHSQMTIVYHQNFISAGFNAISNSRWLNTTSPNGYIALKVVIFQNTGKANAPAIIRPIIEKQKMKVNLNLFIRRGSSSKKVVSLPSFEVAPYNISISSIYKRRAVMHSSTLLWVLFSPHSHS